MEKQAGVRDAGATTPAAADASSSAATPTAHIAVLHYSFSCGKPVRVRVTFALTSPDNRARLPMRLVESTSGGNRSQGGMTYRAALTPGSSATLRAEYRAPASGEWVAVPGSTTSLAAPSLDGECASPKGNEDGEAEGGFDYVDDNVIVLPTSGGSDPSSATRAAAVRRTPASTTTTRAAASPNTTTFTTTRAAATSTGKQLQPLVAAVTLTPAARTTGLTASGKQTVLAATGTSPGPVVGLSVALIACGCLLRMRRHSS